MSEHGTGQGWWVASDGQWYPPEQHPDIIEAGAIPPSAASPVGIDGDDDAGTAEQAPLNGGRSASQGAVVFIGTIVVIVLVAVTGAFALGSEGRDVCAMVSFEQVKEATAIDVAEVESNPANGSCLFRGTIGEDTFSTSSFRATASIRFHPGGIEDETRQWIEEDFDPSSTELSEGSEGWEGTDEAWVRSGDDFVFARVNAPVRYDTSDNAMALADHALQNR